MIYRLFNKCSFFKLREQYWLQISAQGNRYRRIGHRLRLMKKSISVDTCVLSVHHLEKRRNIFRVPFFID